MYIIQHHLFLAYLSTSGRKEDRTLFLLVESDCHGNRVYSNIPRYLIYEIFFAYQLFKGHVLRFKYCLLDTC